MKLILYFGLVYFLDESSNVDDELKSEAKSGLAVKLQDFILNNISDLAEKDLVRKKYEDRLNYEVEMISKMKFSGYFLIVSDYIKWAKSKNIPVGPGRGSGAGSLVAWCLSITDLDPIKFGLIFERFLNPDRISMPDFWYRFLSRRPRQGYQLRKRQIQK